MPTDILQFGYLTALVTAITGNLWCDRRWRLVWWHDTWRALIVTGLGWALFMVWDQVLLAAGIIWPGGSTFATGWRVLPGMPLEELVFLWFLAYQPLVLWEGLKRWQAR